MISAAAAASFFFFDATLFAMPPAFRRFFFDAAFAAFSFDFSYAYSLADIFAIDYFAALDADTCFLLIFTALACCAAAADDAALLLVADCCTAVFFIRHAATIISVYAIDSMPHMICRCLSYGYACLCVQLCCICWYTPDAIAELHIGVFFFYDIC